MDERSKRAEFRQQIEGMSPEQLRKLSEVLQRSEGDVIEEIMVIEELLKTGSPASEPPRSRAAGRAANEFASPPASRNA
jgi:hypothetical protein